MKNQFIKINAILLVSILSACGGGGGGGGGVGVGVGNVTPSEPIGYFAKVDQAFDDPSKLFDFALINEELNDQASQLLAVDLDDDGADEAIFIVNKQPKDNLKRSKSFIYIFKWNVGQSKFLDVTDLYIENNSVIEGNLAWMTAKKFNGQTMILIADNEDRPPLWTGRLRVLAKGTSTKYKLYEVGSNGEADYPGAFIDSLGKFNVYAAGDPGRSYVFENNEFKISNKIMPRLSVGGAYIHSSTGLGKIDTILQAGAADGFKIEAWTLNSNDEWINIGLTTPFSKIATERWMDRYGGFGSIDVYQYDNKPVLGPGSGSIVALACATNKTTSKEVEAFFHIPLNHIKNYTPGELLTWDSKDNISSKIARGKVQNNQLTIDYPVIVGEIGSVNYRTFTCTDANKDGLDDIIVNPIWPNDKQIQEVKPIIYLNKGDGSFEIAKFESLSYEINKSSHYNQSSTEIGDFNGDGKLDFIIFPATPGIDKVKLDTTIQFYRGLKKLD
jgi:hypothetical protein